MLFGGKVVVFDRLFAIFGKYGSLSPKNVGNFFLSKSVFGYLKTNKKVPFATKLEGGWEGVRP